MKQNCWEFKKCGREPGGKKAAELGVCSATILQELDGIHGGKNAGRACWVVAGSLCGGKIQGTYAQKLANCWRCEFMNRVKQEEEGAEAGFSHTRLGMERVKEKEQRKPMQRPQEPVSRASASQTAAANRERTREEYRHG